VAKIKGKNQGKIKDVFSPERSKVAARRAAAAAAALVQRSFAGRWRSSSM
jgi:hypothetical protein